MNPSANNQEIEHTFALYHARKYEQALQSFYQIFQANPDFMKTEAEQYVASFPLGDRRSFWTAPVDLFADTEDLKGTFRTIYDQRVWGGRSGAGSNLEQAILYVVYVQHVIDRFAVESIVDIGCEIGASPSTSTSTGASTMVLTSFSL